MPPSPPVTKHWGGWGGRRLTWVQKLGGVQAFLPLFPSSSAPFLSTQVPGPSHPACRRCPLALLLPPHGGIYSAQVSTVPGASSPPAPVLVLPRCSPHLFMPSLPSSPPPPVSLLARFVQAGRLTHRSPGQHQILSHWHVYSGTSTTKCSVGLLPGKSVCLCVYILERGKAISFVLQQV